MHNKTCLCRIAQEQSVSAAISIGFARSRARSKESSTQSVLILDSVPHLSVLSSSSSSTTPYSPISKVSSTTTEILRLAGTELLSSGGIVASDDIVSRRMNLAFFGKHFNALQELKICLFLALLLIKYACFTGLASLYHC